MWKQYSLAAEMLLHTSRPESNCLVVHLKFSPNHDTPPHKHFIQLKDEPIIETASVADIDITTTMEMENPSAKSAGKRRYFIFFEVAYQAYMAMDDENLLVVEDTRRERAEFLLPGKEQPWGFYTNGDLQMLFQSLALLTIPPVPPIPFSTPYVPIVN